MSDRPLSPNALDFLINNRGAVYEGDLFAFLRQCSEYVVRSWEFATVDGVVLCDDKVPLSMSMADRLFHTYDDTGSLSGRRVLAFDIKGEKRRERLGQRPAHHTSQAQLDTVAFYIAVCAADPRFVEVIPNFAQRDELSDAEVDELQDTRSQGAAFFYNSRISRLPASAWVLDPTASPYRMPLAHLPEAIRRIRQCLLTGEEDYVNPWTLVAFAGWRPKACTSYKLLTPPPHTQHFSAFKAAVDIRRAIRTARPVIPMVFDLVGMQPRIADFKFILDGRQVFVQHKRDAIPGRSSSSRLSRARIGRTENGRTDYFFSHVDRFDFLFYEFEFSDGARAFFFIPESQLPDDFYTTLEAAGDFEQFRDRFYHAIDRSGEWVRAMYNTIQRYPYPRSAGHRPLRHTSTKLDDEATKDNSEAEGTRASTDAGEPDGAAAPGRHLEEHGRHRYMRVLNHAELAFYNNVMRQCAERRCDVLLVLAHEHPAADFLLGQYTWSAEEQVAWLERGIPPSTVDDLRGNVPITHVNFYTRAREISFNGPRLSTAQFRRLNGFTGRRLLVWDLWGSESMQQSGGGEDDVEGGSSPATGCGSLVVVPSADLCPNEEQRQLFQSNLAVSTRVDHPDNTPEISQLLSTGLLLSEYGVGGQGQFIYESSCDWGAVWRLFHAFLTATTVEHPAGFARRGEDYRYPLSVPHTRLVQAHREEKL